MEIFKLLGTIAIDNQTANAEIDETTNKAENSHPRISGAFSKIGEAAVKVGKTIATGLAVGATAMGALTTKALSLGGELEQNMGGSEAVFGEYADKMQQKASEAYSQMGLSASDYLATANKMGSLFKGAGFEMEEASDLAAAAMQRAADVASIMGIDTASAMESIAGAAKGNFTMMDNLGVAMNDTTLQAYALEKGIEKSTQEMTNQEKIGLAMEMFLDKTAYAAGNYAKENETLAGSLGTAKAAFTNFLSGSGTVDEVASSFKNAATVIVENVKEIFPSLMTGITELVQQLLPVIPPLLEELLPGLIEGATGLINGLVAAMPEIVSALTSALPALTQGITNIVNELIEALPQIIESLVDALPSLIPALIDGLVSMIVTLCTNFSSIIQPIIEALPDIIVSVVEALISNLPILIEGAVQLVVGLVAALPQILAALIVALPEALSAIWDGIKNVFSGVGEWFGKKFAEAKELAAKAWDKAKEIWSGIKDKVTGAFQKVGGWFKDKFKEAHENSQEQWAKAKEVWGKVKDNVTGAFSKVGDWFKDKFKEAHENSQEQWAKAKEVWGKVKDNVTSAFSKVGDWFRDKFKEAHENSQAQWANAKDKWSKIKDNVADAFSDIKEKLSKPFENARDTISGIADKIKGFFSGEISLPKIKLPHFTISPEGWKIGDLLKGSLPKLSIEWYAKAMDEPMVMTEPTAFGYNPNTGSVMAGGEAGSEVVSGTSTLMNMIGAVVESKTTAANERIIALLTELLNATVGGNKEMLRALIAGHTLTVNNREFARLVKAVN